MIDEIRALLLKASKPGDLATILIAGTAGFLVDAGLNSVGFLEPGYVGLTAASSALGIKKSIDAALSKRRNGKAQEEKSKEEVHRAESLRHLLKRKGCKELARRIELEIELFETGVSDVASLRSIVTEIATDYRAQARHDRKGAPTLGSVATGRFAHLTDFDNDLDDGLEESTKEGVNSTPTGA